MQILLLLHQNGKSLGRLQLCFATNEYGDKCLKTGQLKIGSMNASYSKTAAALTGNVSGFSEWPRHIILSGNCPAKNLFCLNSVYEMELQDANSHVKTLDKFYSNMTAAMEVS